MYFKVSFFFRLSHILLSLLSISAPTLGQKDMQQKWLGIHNLYYQNSRTDQLDTLMPIPKLQQYKTTSDENNEISFGLHYRIMKGNNTYHEMEFISFDFRESNNLVTLRDTTRNYILIIGGERNKSTNIQMGYRLGKLLPVINNLTADVAIGAYPFYNRISVDPASNSKYPFWDTRIGLSLDVRMGLIYQITQNIIIGYSFRPVICRGFWHRNFVDNPLLQYFKKAIEKVEFDADFLNDLLDLRNFSVSYVFHPNKKEKSRRRG